MRLGVNGAASEQLAIVYYREVIRIKFIICRVRGKREQHRLTHAARTNSVLKSVREPLYPPETVPPQQITFRIMHV